jgi:hypothetical protein
MNYAGFVPAGLMLAAFGVALAALLTRHRVTIAASVLVVLFGCGLTAAGIISCDPGCPQTGGSVEQRLHDGLGPFTVLCLVVAAGILGIQCRRLPAWRHLSVYSLVTSAVALLFLIALMSSLESRTMTGLWQRLLFTALFLWCGVIALRLYRDLAWQSPPANDGMQPGVNRARG